MSHLPCLSGELEVGALHDSIHGAGLLAEAAVDALGHVDIIPAAPLASAHSDAARMQRRVASPRGLSAAILPFLRLDCDCLCRADLRSGW